MPIFDSLLLILIQFWLIFHFFILHIIVILDVFGNNLIGDFHGTKTKNGALIRLSTYVALRADPRQLSFSQHFQSPLQVL